MTIVEITKAKIIKSIQNEPVLGSGNWILFGHNSTLADVFKDIKTHKQDADCSVCAVGSVLRNTLSMKTDSRKFMDAVNAAVHRNVEFSCVGSKLTTAEIFSRGKSVLDDGHPMNALSLVFEGSMDRYWEKDWFVGVSLARRLTVNFVKKHFPEKIQIDIDGAEPAKDVKIVKKTKSRRGTR